MKKTSAKKSPAFNTRRVITLDESQYAIYLTGKIDICCPDGEVIDGVGKLISDKAFALQKEFAVDNLRLIEDLIRSCGDKPLEISDRGALGLANAFWQAQKIID